MTPIGQVQVSWIDGRVTPVGHLEDARSADTIDRDSVIITHLAEMDSDGALGMTGARGEHAGRFPGTSVITTSLADTALVEMPGRVHGRSTVALGSDPNATVESP